MKIKIAFLLFASMLHMYGCQSAHLVSVGEMHGGNPLVFINEHWYEFYDDDIDLGDNVIVFVNDLGDDDPTNDRIEFDIKVGI